MVATVDLWETDLSVSVQMSVLYSTLPQALFDTFQRSKSQQRLKDRPSKANTLSLAHAKPEVWSQLPANN